MFCCFLPCAAPAALVAFDRGVGFRPLNRVRNFSCGFSFLPGILSYRTYRLSEVALLLTERFPSSHLTHHLTYTSEGYAMRLESGHHERLDKWTLAQYSQSHFRNSWRWKTLSLFIDIFPDDISKRGFIFFHVRTRRILSWNLFKICKRPCPYMLWTGLCFQPSILFIFCNYLWSSCYCSVYIRN